MSNFFQIVAGVAILALGIWIGTLFKGCGTTKVVTLQQTDTLVIDTSKIIERTPIIVKSIELIIHDTLSCESSLKSFITEGGDTLSIGRVNSCKGILQDVRISRKNDTVVYDAAEVIRDTVREPFELPSWTEVGSNVFNFGIRAKAGSGFGMVFGTGFDFDASYGKIGLNVSPSLYYLDKFRGFVFIGATYKLK